MAKTKTQYAGATSGVEIGERRKEKGERRKEKGERRKEFTLIAEENLHSHILYSHRNLISEDTLSCKR